MCFPWALAGLLPSAVQVRMRSRSTSARPPSTANIKAPGAGAGVGPPFAEFRDHEIATGPITADATSDPRWVHGPPLPVPIAIAPTPSGLRPPTGIAAQHRENAVTLAEGKHLGAVPGSSARMSWRAR